MLRKNYARRTVHDHLARLYITPMHTPFDRVPVSEAAARLGVTPDAVRQRIRRGTIRYDKDPDGRYHVYMTQDDGRRDGVPEGVQKALIERLHDENEFLRRELERKDAILMNMTETMKAITAPPEPREETETTPDLHPGIDPQGDDAGQEKAEPVSWWRRIFGSD